MSKTALNELPIILPEITSPTVLSWDGTDYIATFPDGNEERSADLMTLYRAIVDKTRNIKFSETLPEYEENFSEIALLLGPDYEEGPSIPLLIGMTDQFRADQLEKDLFYFQNSAENFRNDKNFYNAYHYLNQHPMFWRLASYDEVPSFNWVTDRGVETFSLFVCQDNGSTMVAIEAGPTYIPDVKLEVNEWEDNFYWKTTTHD